MGPRTGLVTLVLGTAGHIDHGKTTLLRALTGIDADRLPEERRRGMTIDVGYAHVALPDGTELDFVDVPGHDRLVGNMLVGAGEIDAALLVVAADDGPRAQTVEHLELLDALGIPAGVAVVTKADAVDEARVATVIGEVGALLAGTSLAGSPVLAVSGLTGSGVPELTAALEELARRFPARVEAPPRLAIDRVFSVKGRGVVVTGTLRGGALERGAILRVEPGGGSVRVREVQVHGRQVDRAEPGRTALNLAAAGVEPESLRRGQVLTTDPAVLGTDRWLVALGVAVPDRTRARLHLGTDAVGAGVARSGRDAIDLPGGRVAAILRLSSPVGAAPGDRFVLRRPSPGGTLTGGLVLDLAPTRGVSRRRQIASRVASLVDAIDRRDGEGAERARVELHGAVLAGGPPRLAIDVGAELVRAATGAVAAFHEAHPAEVGIPLADLRTVVARTLRRAATTTEREAAGIGSAAVANLVASGALEREGERVHLPGRTAPRPEPALGIAADRLEAALTAATPPALDEAARIAGADPAIVRALEAAGRIVRLGPDLAYATDTYRDLAQTALDLARRGPLTPAALRDATGTSRKYVMAILEDLDLRGVLRRSSVGHVPGPRAATGLAPSPGIEGPPARTAAAPGEGAAPLRAGPTPR
jgi:selenocysteine-specific elongation factor